MFSRLNADASAHTRDLFRKIFTLIPQFQENSRRPTRALLPFIGSISKVLFGTSTNHDLAELRSHVTRLAATSSDAINIFQRSQNAMSSVMVVSNQRFDDVTALLNNSYAMITVKRSYMRELKNVIIGIIVIRAYKFVFND